MWARLALLSIAASIRAQSPDPQDMLVSARDRVAANAEKVAKMSCVQTVDRSYFRRAYPPDPRPSCDQLHADLRRSHLKMYLAATDRLRTRVSIGNGSELLTWVDPLPFESHRIEDVLATGPIGTGPFAAFVSNIFGNPRTSIQYVEKQGSNLEYRFREAEGTSHYRARAGSDWLPTGDSGSFLINPGFINPASLALERLIVETSTLPPETSMCEASASVDYQNGENGASLPRQADWRHLLINGDETRSVVNYSSCAADQADFTPPAAVASNFPAKVAITLALDKPIDTDSAAAGDIVSATVTRDIRYSSKVLIPRGATVRGRILNLERRVSPGKYFLLAISFDVIEINGSAAPIRMVRDTGVGGSMLRPDSTRWPELTLVFPNRDHLIVPRGYQSAWLTK